MQTVSPDARARVEPLAVARLLAAAGIALTLACPPVMAAQEQEAEELVPIPEQPDIPPPVQSGETMEPDITVIRREKETVEEYRINNRLYMVKIKPSIGPTYYLLDTDGDGTFDDRRNEQERGMNVPQWVLFSW